MESPFAQVSPAAKELSHALATLPVSRYRIPRSDGFEQRRLWSAGQSRKNGRPAWPLDGGWQTESDAGRPKRRQSPHSWARRHDAHVSSRFCKMGRLACGRGDGGLDP
jgi:hypothetical protein